MSLLSKAIEFAESCIKSEYYREGREAYYSGMSQDRNPYADGTPAHIDWNRGYLKG